MKILTAEEILAADDIKKETVQVPEWGGAVLVQAMTARAKDRFEAGSLRQVGNKFVPDFSDQSAKLVQASAVKEDGSPLFTQKQLEALTLKSGEAMARVTEAARRINGMTEAAVEESVKN